MRGAVRERLRRLVDVEPDSQAAERTRAELEQALLSVVRRSAVRAPEIIARSLAATGLGFRSIAEGPRWEWRAQLPRECQLTVGVQPGPYVRATSVLYARQKTPRLTKRQKEKAALQAAFYERYSRVGRRARAGRRAAAGDSLILLVGDLEADLNNGGFSQYLENKGASVANQAATALESIGAWRTSRMLRTALACPRDQRRLDRLDQEFQQTAEDLPGLAMRLVAKRGG